MADLRAPAALLVPRLLLVRERTWHARRADGRVRRHTLSQPFACAGRHCVGSRLQFIARAALLSTRPARLVRRFGTARIAQYNLTATRQHEPSNSIAGKRRARRQFRGALSSQYRVRITESAGLRPPAWASPWMRGTFAKFGALTLHRYRRVIVLDSDTIVVKNIDHLSGAPPPLAAYFHFDMGSTCPQRPTQEGRCHLGVLNSGVLALEPDASRLAKARQLLTADDGSSLGEQSKDALWETSDQRLWHALYARDTVHELPFAYNANADANLTLGEWRHGVSILHDIVVQRKRGWARSGYAPLVDELTREAKRAFAG